MQSYPALLLQGKGFGYVGVQSLQQYALDNGHALLKPFHQRNVFLDFFFCLRRYSTLSHAKDEVEETADAPDKMKRLACHDISDHICWFVKETVDILRSMHKGTLQYM